MILNRVESSQYPDTVEGVVFDTKYGVQFQPVSNGTIYDAPASSSLVAAKLCLEGTDVVGESLYFFLPCPVGRQMDREQRHLLYHHRWTPVLCLKN